MKAAMSHLGRRMLRAGVRIPLDGQPFCFEGKWYVAKFIPTRPA
jgi:hypothetical protein